MFFFTCYSSIQLPIYKGIWSGVFFMFYKSDKTEIAGDNREIIYYDCTCDYWWFYQLQ